MPRAIDITGQVFGRWTVESYVGSRGGSRFYLARCQCGTVREVNAGNLRKGISKSCGCLNSEVVTARNEASATHGMSATATFTIWVNMIQRCTNPKHKSYPRYGGRGIQVCSSWRSSFEAFLKDMGERPFEGAEIDREDNDGTYEPGNCRWVAPEVNRNNRSVSRHLEFDGRRMTVAQWARELGCSRQALRYRINNGWSVNDALTTPFTHGNCWRIRK